jgi:protein-S-isoprenylcysteine O-methyltransferase Ste14
MAWADRIPSSLLVTLQFALAIALLPGAWPPAPSAALPLIVVLLLAAAAIGGAALHANRPGNFNIRPEPKATARLVTRGIYRWIRHPMYCAVLLAALGIALLDPRPWRFAVWLGLLAVLVVKALREERYLLQRFAPYAEYRARTWRLLPWLW